MGTFVASALWISGCVNVSANCTSALCPRRRPQNVNALISQHSSSSSFTGTRLGCKLPPHTSKEMAMPKRLLWAILFSCLPALILAQAPKKDRLTLDLYLELESVADPQLSPDGSQIIYTRGGVDKVNDKRETSLWIMNADGSRNRFLVQASEPRWSPNGCRT